MNGFSILAAGSTGAGCEDVLFDDDVKLNGNKDRVFDFFQSCGDISYKTNSINFLQKLKEKNNRNNLSTGLENTWNNCSNKVRHLSKYYKTTRGYQSMKKKF